MWDRNLVSSRPKINRPSQQLSLFESSRIQRVRIYHHYETWEEFKAGMWRSVSPKEEKVFLSQAIVFTGNAVLYGSFMLRVVREWPISCEHNLSCTGMNRQAWVGHAACCLAIACPEHITRAAWHYLTEQQRGDANEQASIAIKTWEQERYR